MCYTRLCLLSFSHHISAHSDFVTVRLNGVDTTGQTGLRESKRVTSRTIYYIIAAVVVVLILTGVGGFILYKSRRNRRRRRQGGYPAPEMAAYGGSSLPIEQSNNGPHDHPPHEKQHPMKSSTTTNPSDVSPIYKPT